MNWGIFGVERLWSLRENSWSRENHSSRAGAESFWVSCGTAEAESSLKDHGRLESQTSQSTTHKGNAGYVQGLDEWWLFRLLLESDRGFTGCGKVYIGQVSNTPGAKVSSVRPGWLLKASGSLRRSKAPRILNGLRPD